MTVSESTTLVAAGSVNAFAPDKDESCAEKREVAATVRGSRVQSQDGITTVSYAQGPTILGAIGSRTIAKPYAHGPTMGGSRPAIFIRSGSQPPVGLLSW